MKTSRFFIFFMLAILIICGYFWATDGPGSGMAWPTGIVAVLLIGSILFDRTRDGK